jgi:phosphate acetyltransferase
MLSHWRLRQASGLFVVGVAGYAQQPRLSISTVRSVTRSVYLAAAQPYSGKSALALGLYEHMLRRSADVAVFRPVVRSGHEPDAAIHLLRSRGGVDLDDAAFFGTTYDDVHRSPDEALATIIDRFRSLASKASAVLVLGTDFTGVGAPAELQFNARVAANLGAPVLFIVTAHGRSPQEVRFAIDLGEDVLRANHASIKRVIINRADAASQDGIRAAVSDLEVPVDMLVDEPLLLAPSVRHLRDRIDGTLLIGDPDLLAREAQGVVVAAMTLPNVLDHLNEGSVVITPGDRTDIILSMLSAHRSDTFPSLSGLILSGGLRPDGQVWRLIEGVNARLPVLSTTLDTFETAAALADARGGIHADSARKIETALDLVESSIDIESVLDELAVESVGAVTPLMFQYELVEQSRRDRRHVVLPEGEDPRVLRAAATVLRRNMADLTLLGDEAAIRATATDIGIDISGADVVNPSTTPLRDSFAEEYYRLRQHKGITLDAALDIVADVSYFGTLMVHRGLADGMVSGAVHTTAHTIRPSFEIIKTKPGTSIVSSVFFMCLADRVLVYGDCAVNPNPNAEQLADIAISSADTAAQFGVEPRIAMLSYSTGASGAGEDVERVRAATTMVQERRPDLSVEGPIQYDAAVDASVAKTKLPESSVAGRATVFIFPDLNTGNNTYKAVQRSAGALAIGPVLQGLNKPVNDLSRGALVDDIVNTIAITAVQAQGERS